MTSLDQNARSGQGDSRLAFSIMFFAIALLCLLLGWAEGVRHGTTFMHIPENRLALISAAVLGALGFLFLIWSRLGRRS